MLCNKDFLLKREREFDIRAIQIVLGHDAATIQWPRSAGNHESRSRHSVGWAARELGRNRSARLKWHDYRAATSVLNENLVRRAIIIATHFEILQ